MQSALARDLEANIQSYYNFDSNIINPNYTNEVNKKLQLLHIKKTTIAMLQTCNLDYS